MQHGAIRHGQRQILRPAAAKIMCKIKSLHLAERIEAHLIIHAAIMAFSGDNEVIISVIAHLAGSSGEAGRHGTGHGQRIALAFLAAKAAAHAPDLHTHRMLGNIQRF